MTIRPLLKRVQTVLFRLKSEEAAERQSIERSSVHEGKKDPIAENTVVADNDQGDPNLPQEGLQHGVRDVEAVTLTWSKSTLIFVFANIWFLYFVNAFQSAVFDSLSAYVSSSFSAHSLSGVPAALADAFSAAVYLPVGKLMDTWGRAEGFLLMTTCATIGLILLAACNSFSIYCAAYVFYYIGFGGMSYSVDVITADSSRLQNRALAYAFTSSPYIITAFAGPKVGDRFYSEVSWRWGFGCWAIVFPIVAAPLYFVLKFNLRKAQREGHRIQEKSNRNVWQSICYWIMEFDLPGVIIFTAGLVVFELPFDIASDAPNGWGTDYIIAMIVVGFSMIFFFGLYEKYLATTPLLKWQLLTNRTVLGACLIDATYQLSYYCWYNYFQSWLQVNNNLTIAEAGYIAHTFDIVSGILLIIVGFIIRKTGRFKWLLYIAVPLYIFSQGLMIYFRKPNMSWGYQVMCQIFISIGGSVFILTEQLAILAAVDHQHVAAALGLLNVVGTIGGSAGNTICTSIWTNTFYTQLQQRLPAYAMSNIDNIYSEITEQKKYAVGTPARTAIQDSYAYVEVILLSTGCGLMGLAIVWTLMIRNIDLKKVPQVKGTVF